MMVRVSGAQVFDVSVRRGTLVGLGITGPRELDALAQKERWQGNTDIWKHKTARIHFYIECNWSVC